jgi:hypothetical protein
VAPGMQHPGPWCAVPALGLTEPALVALPANPDGLKVHPQLLLAIVLPDAPQQPATGGEAVPVLPESQLALAPGPRTNVLGQALPWVGHTLTGAHKWHDPPLCQLQQQQQPAMKPHSPATLPQELPEETTHWLNVGVIAAIAVGAVIDRISGAVATAAPTFAERPASSRRVMALPLPLPVPTLTSSRPWSSSCEASSSSTASRTSSSERLSCSEITVQSLLPSQACQTRAAVALRQCARWLTRSYTSNSFSSASTIRSSDRRNGARASSDACVCFRCPGAHCTESSELATGGIKPHGQKAWTHVNRPRRTRPLPVGRQRPGRY